MKKLILLILTIVLVSCTYTDSSYDYKLISYTDNIESNTSGTFIIGSGSINGYSDLMYNCMVQTSNGIIYPLRVDSKHTRIIYTEDDSKVNIHIRGLSINPNLDAGEDLLYRYKNKKYPGICTPIITFYIPENSIKYDNLFTGN